MVNPDVIGDRPWPRPRRSRGQANGRTSQNMELYILESLKDGTHYVGISENAETRLGVYHNNGRVKATKNKRPWKIIYREQHAGVSEAREREKYLKSYKGVTEKKKIIENYIQGSSNGRTSPSEGEYLGSNPWLRPATAGKPGPRANT